MIPSESMYVAIGFESVHLAPHFMVESGLWVTWIEFSLEGRELIIFPNGLTEILDTKYSLRLILKTPQ